MWKFLSLVPATAKGKKWKAIFADGPKRKSVSFGAAGMRDFTIIEDRAEALKARDAYRTRHAGDNLTDPLSPGALSWYLLWGDSQNMKTNLQAYLKRFGL